MNKKVAKWSSLILVISGLIVGIIGVACDGLSNVNYLFWI
jgi:hypothetical protein